MKEEMQNNALITVLQHKERSSGLISEASRILCEAAAAAQRTQKKATLTLTLSIEPQLNALNVKADLKSKLPPDEQPICIFYVDGAGELSRSDPNQAEFRFKSHEGGAGGSGDPQHRFGHQVAASGSPGGGPAA